MLLAVSTGNFEMPPACQPPNTNYFYVPRFFLTSLRDFGKKFQTFQSHLVCGQDPEGIDDLLRGVDISRFSCHEVEEAVELDITTGVRVDN